MGNVVDSNRWLERYGKNMAVNSRTRDPASRTRRTTVRERGAKGCGAKGRGEEGGARKRMEWVVMPVLAAAPARAGLH